MLDKNTAEAKDSVFHIFLDGGDHGEIASTAGECWNPQTNEVKPYLNFPLPSQLLKKLGAPNNSTSIRSRHP